MQQKLINEMAEGDGVQVSGRDYQLLNEALVDSFDNDSLAAMLQYGLSERLDVLVGIADLNTMVFKLIEKFRQRDQVEKLVQAARRFNPTNSRLYEVAQSLERTTQVTANIGDGVTPVAAMDLEKLVRRQVPKLNVREMREHMMRVEGQMCVVERRLLSGQGEAKGTGFLIGPRAVLTNYHVVEDYLQGDQAQNLQVRFDALLQEEGVREPEEGIVLAVEAIPITQPYTQGDTVNTNQPPAANELDFAILLLDEEAGRGPVGGNAGPLQSKVARGWMKIPDPDPVLESGAPLIIYQYPGGRELTMAIDTEAVIGMVWDDRRVRYRNNTERGSSGSPVFNFDWELVALHHAGAPGPEPAPYNQGIPIARIAESIRAQQLAHLLSG